MFWEGKNTKSAMERRQQSYLPLNIYGYATRLNKYAQAAVLREASLWDGGEVNPEYRVITR